MLIRFSSNSTNAGGDPVLYLTAASRFDGTVRNPQPAVVRGDPGQMIEAINQVPFKHKYSSFWMSWAPDEKISPEMEQHQIKWFEDSVMFPGIPRANRPPTLWVRHTHTEKGRHELHGLTTRALHLRDAEGMIHPKSINIAPPGEATRATILTFQELQNARYGWASPMDPERRRDVVLSAVGERTGLCKSQKVNAKTPLLDQLQERLAQAKTRGEKFRGTSHVRDDLRLVIAAHLRREVDSGHIHDRGEVVGFLQAQGLTIRRIREDSITVGIPGLRETFPGLEDKDACIRLKGGLFREDFDPSERLESEPKGKTPIYGRPDPERAAELEATLARLSEARALYNRARYGQPVSPDNDNSSKSFAEALQQMLNNPAIGVDRQAFLDHLHSHKEKKRRRRIHHYNSATGQVWEQEVEEDLER